MPQTQLMLAGGQIAGVSGPLPRYLELKHSRSHASRVTPENDQTWRIGCPDSVAKAGVLFACLSVHGCVC